MSIAMARAPVALMSTVAAGIRRTLNPDVNDPRFIEHLQTYIDRQREVLPQLLRGHCGRSDSDFYHMVYGSDFVSLHDSSVCDKLVIDMHRRFYGRHGRDETSSG